MKIFKSKMVIGIICVLVVFSLASLCSVSAYSGISLSEEAKIDSAEDDMLHAIEDYVEVDEEETISKKDITSDEYSKSINFLKEIGAIEVYSDGTIINVYSDDDFANEEINPYSNKKIDYDALYQEAIKPTGKYYGILSEDETKKLTNHVNMSLPDNDGDKESLEIVPAMLSFDYYQKTLQNTTLLSYTLASYENVGYTAPLAWYYTGLFFVNKVKTGGDWDYKVPMGRTTPYYCDMNNYYGVYTGGQIGNMHYGTVGSYLFSAATLKSAAGLYQIYSGTAELSWFASYFDDPNDQTDIQRGINLHSNFNFPDIRHLQN